MLNKAFKQSKIKKQIFLDYAAGTEPNPSSIHKLGVLERQKLERARKDIAKLIAVKPGEIIFTSGGTEANNIAVLGVFRAALKKVKPSIEGLTFLRPHIITSPIEHASVREAVRQAEQEGAKVSYLPVRSDGVVDISKLESLLKTETIIVSLMHANNETGTLQPVREVGLMIQKIKTKNYSLKTPYFHIDACQTAGYKSIEPNSFFADLMTVSGHKVYGPKGTGFLFVKNGTNIDPLIFGGGQEHGLRSGTENVGGQVAFSEAFTKTQEIKNQESKRLEELRDYFISELKKFDLIYNGSKKHQLPNIVNLSFINTESDRMVLELDARGIAVSAGSACHSNQSMFSPVIALMKGEELAKSAIRFSLGKDTKKRDLDIVVKTISDILNKINN